MNMFLSNSQDVLWLSIALAVLVVTFFFCWMMYYVIRILRNTVYTIEKFTGVLKKLDEVLDLIKEKLSSAGTYVALVAKGVEQVMEMMEAKKSRGRKKK